MRYLIFAVNVLLAAFVAVSSAQATPGNKLVEKAKSMSVREVAHIYKGRTWMWPDGAGYFRDNGHFYAWSGSGKNATYATGKWAVTKTGQICFDANWNHRMGSTTRQVCFSHRKHGAVIYQRKDPSGEWYVFRSSPVRVGDEATKLLKSDRVTPNLNKVSRDVKRKQEIAQQHTQEFRAQSDLNGDYALYKTGKYRLVLTRLNERAKGRPESREAGLLRGWTLFQLMQYDKARDQFAALDKQRSTSETQHGLFYAGVKLNSRYLGGW
ncbi:DUF995 domain-containing protein [Microvirga puerhi]|uniref:DUF995 domain-containing protein n=1 Tax=Microvirga puerhi TaxID=2876078 RepID=A0ABS7VU64_9HYPH|nr:DUF995 domain-containing protein [Microvirga puerhi]MBZ6079109.1 DUF995 domain-containing protein [Microvirga puerhi]